jgi:hypothetical protein
MKDWFVGVMFHLAGGATPEVAKLEVRFLGWPSDCVLIGSAPFFLFSDILRIAHKLLSN